MEQANNQEPTFEQLLRTAEAQRDALAVELADAREQLESAIAEVTGLKASAAKAERAPKVRNAKGRFSRKIGPLNREAEPSAAELLEAIAGADEVQVAFSNGKTEIGQALEISGDAWQVMASGLVLKPDVPVAIEGPCKLAGYGLVLDGELVAYRPRMDALILGAGEARSLNGDVVF